MVVNLVDGGAVALTVGVEDVGVEAPTGPVEEATGDEAAELTTMEVLGCDTIDPPGVRSALVGSVVLFEVQPASSIAASKAPVPARDNP